MTPEITRLDGCILLPVNDARDLLDALRVLDAILPETGRKSTPKLRALRDSLSAACDGKSGVDARTPVPQSVSLESVSVSSHDLLDTEQAARLLHCTASNVRDLARRGALPARRAQGRWLFEETAVRLRAERSHAA